LKLRIVKFINDILAQERVKGSERRHVKGSRAIISVN